MSKRNKQRQKGNTMTQQDNQSNDVEKDQVEEKQTSEQEEVKEGVSESQPPVENAPPEDKEKTDTPPKVEGTSEEVVTPVVPVVPVTPEPVVTPTPEPTPVVAPVQPEPVKLGDVVAADDSTKTSKAETQLTENLIADDLSPGTRMALMAVKTYEEKMRAGAPMTAKVGGPQQRSLYTALRQIIAIQSHTEFKKAFTALLSIIQTDKHGAFKPHRINRFLSEAPFGINELGHYSRLIDMLVAMAPPATRDVMKKQIDVRGALMGSEANPFFSDIHVNRVTEFFAGNL